MLHQETAFAERINLAGEKTLGNAEPLGRASPDPGNAVAPAKPAAPLRPLPNTSANYMEFRVPRALVDATSYALAKNWQIGAILPK